MEIGEKINRLRTEKGMTLEELGDIVGVGKSTVRKWETGIIANMRRDKIAKLAEALNVTPAYLMGWDDSEPEPFICTPVEQAFVERYREADDGTRAAVNKLLDISEVNENEELF